MNTNMRRWRRNSVRTTDPDTSRKAIANMTPARLSESQLAVLNLIARAGGTCTDEELVEWYGDFADLPQQSPSGLRTRRHELVKQGAVRDTGLRRASQSGRECIVWGIVHDREIQLDPNAAV